MFSEPSELKAPDIYIYDYAGNDTDELRIIENEKLYRAQWNAEKLNRDQFKENGNISFTVEIWLFLKNHKWIKQKILQQRQSALFKIEFSDYNNGMMIFKQNTNKPRKFHFTISVIVVMKHTKNLNIFYTSTFLFFAPKLSGASDNNVILNYCNLWLKETREIVHHRDLESCYCTEDIVHSDPDFITDPMCFLNGKSCLKDNVTCYLKRLE